ncbi:PREDICTED: cation/H(+) antiporter 8-like [Camelina sativa]|uniref:Cation/H(+) antiporter 8-like n=1 Tax=Camelina sativa TaxID=90675 RepID=A0ABM0WF01_CAMSA|nr:PREDICTED: cation/H(+) antiporter 8-like [Camelina sativa]
MDMGNGTGPGMSGDYSGGGEFVVGDDVMPGMGGGGNVIPGMEGGDVMQMSPELNWIYEMAWYGESKRGDGFFCEEHPSKLTSDGIWERLILKTAGLNIWQYRLPNLEIVILLVFFFWQAFTILFKKLGLSVPKFSSMMLAGLLLNVMLTLSGNNSIIGEILVPKNRIDIPGCLGSFGFMIFWFLKGVKMDVKRLFKAEAKARVTGIAAVTFPVVVGFLLSKFRSAKDRSLSSREYDTVLLMESLTSFSGIARLLRDLGMNHSSIGRVALSSSLISDLVGLLIMLVNVSLASSSISDALALIVEISLYLLMTFKVVRPFLFKVIKRKREGRPIKDKYIFVILILLCFSCMYWNLIEQNPALGAFVLGLAIPSGPPIGSVLVERLESFNFGIVLPLFLSATMLRADIRSWNGALTFFSGDDKKFAVTSLVLLVFLLKLFVAVIVPYVYKMPLQDSVILSLIMSHKGIIELNFYFYIFSVKGISRDIYSILVLCIVINSMVLPVVIGFLYDPSKQFLCYQKRNLESMKNTGELKTLVCIHRPDHISSMINLLEASYQSEESPLTSYVLHLVELQGQDVPTLISHKVQKLGIGSEKKYSENVILSFEHFHRYVSSSISIDTFTCIANANHMQDDICWLALDKAVSLIILPFHRTWSLDRTSIVSDAEMIRFLNFNVLKQAPCSVGILVERHLVNKKQDEQQSLKVCVVFVGGRDDREALAFAKRMARQENVTLTVLRLVASGKSKEATGWDQMLDMVELREMMKSKDSGMVKEERSTIYMEQEILDGADTSMLLRSMAFDYDLFVVGRTCGENHEATSGIANWCEFEELGVIGDFLASPDFPSKTSVLVVQQQRSLANYD